MKKFTFEVTDVTRKVIMVSADNYAEAERKVRNVYPSGANGADGAVRTISLIEEKELRGANGKHEQQAVSAKDKGCQTACGEYID